MATKIQIKRSTTAGATPTLSAGELAVNLADKRLFTANSTAVFDAVQQVNTDFRIVGTTPALRVGNSTVNLVANSTMLKLSNSTVNTSISIPTSAQYSGDYFLHANGSWVEISASSGNVATRVYEKFTATASQNTFTITGEFVSGYVDVYYNGIHLTTDDYAEVGTDTIQLTEDAIEGAIIEVVALSEIDVMAVESQAQGSNTQVQFNDSGVLAGSAGFTFDKTTNTLSVANSLILGGTTLALGNAVIGMVEYTSASTSSQTIATFDKSTYRTCVFQLSITSGSNYQTSTIKIIHDGTNAYLTESDVVFTDSRLATFSTVIASDNVALNAAPTSAVTTFKIHQTLFKV